jgi:small multidrug resistance family-3 protein
MTYLIYALAALAEISGCFAFWAWLKLDRSPAWALPGMVSLAAFAWLLTRIPADAAGRAYAAYGGVYIAASLLWLWLVEHQRPDRFDIAGALVCLAGSAIILLPARQ